MWLVCPTSAPLKGWFPSPRRYQVQVAWGLGVGVCVHFLSSSLGVCLVWSCAGHMHAVIVSVCEFLDASALLCLETSWSPYSLSVPLSHRSLSLEERDIHIPLRAEYSEVSSSLHVVQLQVSVLITFQYTRQLLCWRVSDTVMDSSDNTLLGVTLTQLLKTLSSFCLHGLYLPIINENKKFK